ncbi:maleylpyruvate isomerase family mycothiol-dependent enzyme [Dermatobacter hominis]|uniref:maleylpyruvate isomerase family mycothiol-dependent enzyme n=1 Tax=Dermatobacter hominis TaxID=2884263 RepID=UPI001D10A469|nr:maleylpyruvate isomerase family mycothiol-dependent enzyme [Dermatobacter hominis]UDY36312.1 maleylpyruvate isomerase family mycothiol-dependent enzyme [Dermatobacter hominis]
MTTPGLGEHYLQVRRRVDALLRDQSEDRWRRPVPACPGWQVRDVLAHLYGNVEDGAAGRITGVPDARLTDEQVERHRADPPLALLDGWAEVAPLMAEAIERGDIWPALIDAVAHEHDIRGALGEPGARDDPVVVAIAGVLADGLVGSAPSLRIELGSRTCGRSDAELVLVTTPFELVRGRLGRRTMSEVAALDWSSVPPGAVLDQYFVFGPASVPLGE